MDRPFASYAPDAPRRSKAWDEMFAPDGEPRPAFRRLHEALDAMPGSEVETRAAALSRDFRDQGITFQLSGREEPFPLDVVPRVLTCSEWELIEKGVAQRVRALEAFLSDIYGDQLVLRDGVVPTRLVVTSEHFHRAASGIEPPNGVRIHVSGVDLIRDEAGTFRVLEDNLRNPSGVSYVLENRRTMSRVFPELFSDERVRRVSMYPSRLLSALRASAPPGRDDPRVVVMTPGIHNSAYFEHALLARRMGVELVEGRDLVCRGNTVWMRTTEGEQQVDVVYRRVDDIFLDPLQFRADSLVGCPGLLNAARSGNVTIANAVGNGVADDKLLYTYVPDLVRYYLDEEAVLPNVETYRLEDPEQLAHVLEHLDELVVKPVEGAGGSGLVVGPSASEQELTDVRAAILRSPRSWIAQPVVQLSTAPTLTEEGFAPRHVDLRPFAINDGKDVWVLPGGLTRVALPEGSLVVNSSRGGGSKDTWVLAEHEVSRSPTGADAVEQVALDDPTPGRARSVSVADPPQHAFAAVVSADNQQQQQRARGGAGC